MYVRLGGVVTAMGPSSDNCFLTGQERNNNVFDKLHTTIAIKM